MSKAAKRETVATLGPASWALAEPLRAAGATAFRLNASHMDVGEITARLGEILDRIRGFPVIIDLQGAKMRLGRHSPLPVRAGESIRFSLHGEAGTCPLPHRELFASVVPGDTLGCDDGRIRFRVEAVRPDGLDARSLSDGVLLERKGVNVIEHPVVMIELSESDRGRVSAAQSLGCSSFAFSFMKDGSEAEWIRRIFPGCRVTGKIERAEAIENMAALSRRVDEIWICRGDLGAQLGPAPMARWISRCDPHSISRPVHMAGQILEHLTHHAEPTRSEVCHLFDLVSRGFAGFILSDETAVGVDPVRAVRTLHSLLEEFQ